MKYRCLNLSGFDIHIQNPHGQLQGQATSILGIARSVFRVDFGSSNIDACELELRFAFGPFAGMLGGFVGDFCSKRLEDHFQVFTRIAAGGIF